MKRLTDTLARAELRFNERKTERSALIYIFRCWQIYMLANDINALNKAYYAAVSARAAGPASARLCLCLAFLELQLNNFDRAGELLSEFSYYKNYFRQNDALICAVFYFLSAALDLITGREPRAKRKMKNVRDLSETLPPDEYFLLLGAFETERGDFGAGYVYLADCYANGGNSVFMYIYLYRLFITQSHVEDTRGMFLPFLHWSINSGLNLELAADHYGGSVAGSLTGLKIAERLYAQYPFNWLLEYICGEIMTRRDFSESDRRYLKQAEHRQLDLPDLDLYLMTASYLNNSEDVRRYTMVNYLKRPVKDFLLRVFAYHLVITDERLSGLLTKDEIVEFAAGLDVNIWKGRYFNTLYAFLIRESKKMKIGAEVLSRAESALADSLFGYEAEIAEPGAGYIWIYEEEKRDRGVYKISDGKARITAVSGNFKYILTDAGQKNILGDFSDGRVVFRKLIENADEDFYLYFIDNQSKDSDLYIGLSAMYTASPAVPETGADILNVTLSFKNISQSFRMRLAAALGNLLAGRDRYDKAMEYYRLVDINYLNEGCIEQMLSAFVRAGYLKEAVDLIVKKPHCISDRGMFRAIKEIAADGSYDSEIADAAYELLLKSWYDKRFIDIVLNRYNGGQEEWQELARSLAGIQASDARLDERIVNNSIWMHVPDAVSQSVFLRMTESAPENGICEWFVYYLIYEMLINNFKPEYETIDYLEKSFLAEEDKFLAYALFVFYTEHSAQTVRSEEIINRALDLMREDGILFPSVSRIKDKNALRPYILKNQPFLYRALPGRRVYLYYRFDSDADYDKALMRYLRYGLYYRVLPVFYGESVTYRFAEEMESGSVSTPESEITNLRYSIRENPDDDYFTLNNAFVYESMFRYDQVEQIITDSVGGVRMVRGKLL